MNDKKSLPMNDGNRPAFAVMSLLKDITLNKSRLGSYVEKVLEWTLTLLSGKLWRSKVKHGGDSRDMERRKCIV